MFGFVICSHRPPPPRKLLRCWRRAMRWTLLEITVLCEKTVQFGQLQWFEALTHLRLAWKQPMITGHHSFPQKSTRPQGVIYFVHLQVKGDELFGRSGCFSGNSAHFETTLIIQSHRTMWILVQILQCAQQCALFLQRSESVIFVW